MISQISTLTAVEQTGCTVQNTYIFLSENNIMSTEDGTFEVTVEDDHDSKSNA